MAAERRRADSNRRWRFCRPLPYHLATAPLVIPCWRAKYRIGRPRDRQGRTAPRVHRDETSRKKGLANVPPGLIIKNVVNRAPLHTERERGIRAENGDVMAVFAAFISCLSMLIPTVGHSRSFSATAGVAVVWQPTEAFNTGSVIQCPAGLPHKSNSIVKSAHDPALAEEDSTGLSDDLCLAQAVIHFDAGFVLDTSAPRLFPVSRLQSSNAPISLRC